ncbi:hypothetical protein YQE_11143, partial [Dendroctonus ponderosae]
MSNLLVSDYLDIYSHMHEKLAISKSEPDSKVFGSISEGVFEGKIVSPSGSYYVEKAHHYFPQKTHPNRTFHSVIYHEDHVHDPYEAMREGRQS